MIKLEELHPQYIKDEKGREIFILIPAKSFNTLLEDIEDLAIALERRDEDTVSHKEILKELHQNGIL